MKILRWPSAAGKNDQVAVRQANLLKKYFNFLKIKVENPKQGQQAHSPGLPPNRSLPQTNFPTRHPSFRCLQNQGGASLKKPKAGFASPC